MKFKVVEGWVEKIYRTVDVILVDDNDKEIDRELVHEYHKENTDGEDLGVFDINVYNKLYCLNDDIENKVNILKIKHKIN